MARRLARRLEFGPAGEAREPHAQLERGEARDEAGGQQGCDKGPVALEAERLHDQRDEDDALRLVDDPHDRNEDGVADQLAHLYGAGSAAAPSPSEAAVPTAL